MGEEGERGGVVKSSIRTLTGSSPKEGSKKTPDNYQNVNLKLRAMSFKFCDLFKSEGLDFFPFGMFWS